MKHIGGLILGALALSIALAVGCKDDALDPFIATADAGADTGLPEAGADGAPLVDPTLGGPCNDDAQCDDQIDCTTDTCDKVLSRCRTTPDDTKCADPMFCNGAELCVLRQGCVPGAVVTCQDDNACTIDKCVEADHTCTHVPRDSDGDGDPDDHCSPDHDCDDTDPTVSSTKQEVCGNFRDDNCNGAIDEMPCAVPENDRCETAITVTTSTILQLTTVATKLDYPTSCASSITGAQDIVVAITVPAGGPKDVLVLATTPANGKVAVALEATCGATASEIQCANYRATNARGIARSVAAGKTIYAIVTTEVEGKVDVKVDLLAPTTHPTNETCDAPKAIPLDTAVPFSILDASPDLAQSCFHTNPNTGELTYSFTLDATRDVKIYASTTFGDSNPLVSFRSPACTEEPTRCSSGAVPLFIRSLPKGTYLIDVAAYSQIDGNLIVQTFMGTTAGKDESCADPPVLAANKTEIIDLTKHEHLIDDDCPTNFRDMSASAARKLAIGETSDVLLVTRVAFNETGTIGLKKADCVEPSLTCGAGQSPAKASLRAVAPGDYRVVVGDEFGQSSKVIALVRPTLGAVVVNSDTCADAATIPESGGYFTGDTSTRTADYNTACDAANQPVGTAKDQVLKLTLSAKKRVVFDMSGSAYNTLIDIRQGVSCPGLSVGCYPSFSPGVAFLDLNLDAGTYFILIDGFSGTSGKWNLDVRVLDQEALP